MDHGTQTAGASRRCVLLVEDGSDEREMYAQYLQRAGYLTLQGRSAEDGLRLAVELAPDIIVTDGAMPGRGDGFELTRRLKADPQTRSIPVIVLTGHAFEIHRSTAQDVGCDCFLTKPCLPDRLEREVRLVLESVQKKAIKRDYESPPPERRAL